MFLILSYLALSTQFKVGNGITGAKLYVSLTGTGDWQELEYGSPKTIQSSNDYIYYQISTNSCPFDTNFQTQKLTEASKTFKDIDLETYRDGTCFGVGIQFEHENLQYTVTSENEVELTGHSKCPSGPDLTLPGNLEHLGKTYTLTSITLMNLGVVCSRLTGKITIPDTVTSIGYAVFANSKFTSVQLSKNLVSIGSQAFSNAPIGNKYKNTLELPAKLQSIGARAFSSNMWRAGPLNLPETLKTIGDDAFYYGRFTGDLDLSHVTTYGSFQKTGFNGKLILPTDVDTIPENAFSECGFTGLIEIPEAVTKIGTGAFKNQKGSPTFKFLGDNAPTCNEDVFDQGVTVQVKASVKGFCGATIEVYQKSAVLKINDNLNGYTIFYKIINVHNDFVEYTKDSVIAQDAEFNVQFAVSNSGLNNCDKAPLGEAVHITSANQNVPLSKDLIGSEYCVSPTTYYVNLKNGLDPQIYTVKYTNSLTPDVPETEFPPVLTHQSTQVFIITLHIATTLTECPATTLEIPALATNTEKNIVESDLEPKCQQKVQQPTSTDDKPLPSITDDEKPTKPEDENPSLSYCIPFCSGNEQMPSLTLKQLSEENKGKEIGNLLLEINDDTNLDDLDVLITNSLIINSEEAKLTGKLTSKNIDTKIGILTGNMTQLADLSIEMKSSGAVFDSFIGEFVNKMPPCFISGQVKELIIDFGDFDKDDEIVSAYISTSEITNLKLKSLKGSFSSTADENEKLVFSAAKLNEDAEKSDFYIYKYKFEKEEGKSNVGLIVGVVVAVVVVIAVVVVVVIFVIKKKKKDASTSK